MVVRIIVTLSLLLAVGTNLLASDSFIVAVTNALETKSGLVDPVFTNYIYNCAGQSTNAEVALTANLIQTVISLEQFENTMDESCLRGAFQSATNALNRSGLICGSWQYLHAQLQHAICMNTDNNVQGAYIVASNTWYSTQNAEEGESANIVSDALLRYYGLDQTVSLRDAVAAFTSVAAEGVGNTNECERLKAQLPDRLKRRVESFLRP